MGLPKLSYQMADKIRKEMKENPKMTGKSVAERYQVCPATISMLKNDVIWVRKTSR